VMTRPTMAPMAVMVLLVMVARGVASRREREE
jgi:hypothetical protein